MQLPNTIDTTTLEKYASKDETHAVRVILLRVSNRADYRLRCRQRTYIFKFHYEHQAHVLDVPVSVWQDRSSLAQKIAPICDDLRGSDAQPVNIHVIPFKDAICKPSDSADADLDRSLDVMEKLIAAIASGQSPERFDELAKRFPGIISALGRDSLPVADELLRKHGRTETADFAKVMWSGEAEEAAQPPAGEPQAEESTTTPKKATKASKGKKKAKKAAPAKA